MSITPVITLPQEKLLQWPVFTASDEAAVLRVIRDGNVSTHPVIQELEADCRNYFQRRHALAHCNGTAALLAAFHALGLRPGDEVLVPSATFWASALPMVWRGLVPVFCESEPDTLGLDPADAERRVTPRTKAVVSVHLWGLPAKVAAIQQLADRHGLRIIEDASHAHGATVGGVPCGKFGDVSVFSLQGDKLVPAGEGGVLLTDNDELHERALCLGDITRIIKLPTASRRFAATSFGVKTRIAPMSAALGRAMLSRLAENNAARNRNHRRLAATLEALGFDCFLPAENVGRVWFEFIIRHRRPDFPVVELMKLLQQAGCRASAPRYPLLHQQPFFTEGHWLDIGRYPADVRAIDYSKYTLPNTEKENARLIRLPNFPRAESAPLAEQYAAVFRQAVNLL